MKRFDIITVLPDIVKNFFEHSILKRAIQKKIIEVNIHNLREFSTNKHKTVDDYVYGGASGMVLQVEPIDRCIHFLKEKNHCDEIIYTSPDGELLNQKIANDLSLKNNIVILCGHYKGVDERVREHLITREISIGNYVLSGGELPSLVLCDSIIRLIPGVINDETSALTDSFQNNMIAPPIYTRPAEYKNWKVPKELLSGNKKIIDEWNHQQRIIKTKEKRPELLYSH
ncbi:MAG: tRNA (guanosine(37)-N1)-methyltransferase TrmD [Chitinophagaceae bacterium]|nr:tRNA (guanosine(37)-N1)-methyltransferase TrmD [Chitinophagaceae bacterium]